jgi:hypothetical protein
MTVNFIAGLNRSRSITGGSGHRLRAYPIKNGKNKAFFSGDPVRLSNGTLDIATNLLPVLGVARSYHWVDDLSNRPQYSMSFPAGTSNKGLQVNEGFNQPFALVDDDPMGTWIIRSETSTSAGQIGTVSKVTGAGTQFGVYGRSACRADVSGSSVSVADGMFRIIGLYRISEITSAGGTDNAFDADANTLLEVTFVNHLYNR